MGSDPVTQTLEPSDPITQEYTIRGDLITVDGTYELQRHSQGPFSSVDRGQQGNNTGQQNNTTAQPDNETRRRPPREAESHLLEYKRQDDEEFQAYQPTVSITVSTKSLLPDL